MPVRASNMIGGISPMDFTNFRNQMNDLQRQIGTGKKSDTYGGLGQNASSSISYRRQLTSIDAFQQTITDITTRFSLIDKSLSQFSTINTEGKAALRYDDFRLSSGQTIGQVANKDRLDQALGILNTEINGRYLFGGRDTQNPPVLETSKVMNGDQGKDGFNIVTTQRRMADLGGDLAVTDPLAANYPTGRLVGTYLTAPVAPAATYSVKLDEDGAHSFGMKFDAGTTLPKALTSTITGLTASVDTVSAGVNGLTLTLDASAAQPVADQTLTIPLKLPDGRQKNIILTVAAPGTSTLQPNQFRAGDTADQTILNIQTALKNSVDRMVRTDLTASSAAQAGNDFFKGDANGVPIRITPGAGSNYATASGFASQADATATTVRWYKGDTTSTDPRKTATAKIDTSVTVNYGMRADEEGLRRIVQSLAVSSSMVFTSDDQISRERYTSLIDSVGNGFNTTGTSQSIVSLRMEIASAQTTTNDARTRHQQTKNMMTDLLDGVEGVSTEQAAAELLALQTQVQASYQTAAMLSKLTLVNYIG